MSTRKEKLLQKLNPKLLKITPKLSGATGSIIDLGGSDNTLEDGAKKLMMRFIKNQDISDKFKNNSVQESVEVTVSSVRCNENDEICELISERLLLPHSGSSETDHASERPGRKLQKLKMELQDKISAKWEEEYKKRVSEIESSKRAETCKEKEKGDEETDSLLDDDSGLDDDGEDSSSSSKKKEVSKESLENDIDADYNSEEEEEKKETFVDDEAAEVDENDDSSSMAPLRSDDEDSEDEIIPEDDNANDADMSGDDEDDDGESSLIPAYQPGGGLLNGGSELTQAEDCLPKGLFSPSLRLSVGESPNSKSPSDYFVKNKEDNNYNERRNLFMERRKLFSQVQNPDEAYDLNDAFEFCSGKFPETNEHGSINLGTQNLDSQDIATNNEYKLTGTTQLTLEENSQSDKENKGVGKDSPENDKPKTKRRIMTFDENEVDEDCQLDSVEEEITSAPRVLLDDEDNETGNSFAPPNKRKMKSLHFSDEEDEANDCEAKTKIDEQEENEKEEEEEDEENSEDEEERDDQRSINYDSEENEITNPKEFFEREAELSGSEFSGDEDERGLDEFDYEAGDADNLDQDKVRSQLEKIHIRRVLDDDAREVRLIQELLFEDGDLHSDGKRRDRKFKWKNLGTFDDKPNETESKEDQGNSSDEDCAEEEQLRKLRHEKELFLMESKNNKDSDSEGEIVDETFLKLKMTTARESYKLSVSTETRVEIHKNLLDSSKAKLPLSVCNARGSFLTRNEEFLSKLAKATSTASDNVTGTKNFKNFVFATKSPEKVDSDKSVVCKRQAEDAEICSRQEKKIKLIPPKIIDTGPSILDLLV